MLATDLRWPMKVLSSQRGEPFSNAWKQSRRRLEAGSPYSVLTVSTQCCFSPSIETSGVSCKLSGPSPPLDERFTSLSKRWGSGSARGMVSPSIHNSSCNTMTYGEFALQESAPLLDAFLARSFQWMCPFENFRCRPVGCYSYTSCADGRSCSGYLNGDSFAGSHDQ
jgi:hypothetical protein